MLDRVSGDICQSFISGVGDHLQISNVAIRKNLELKPHFAGYESVVALICHPIPNRVDASGDSSGRIMPSAWRQ